MDAGAARLLAVLLVIVGLTFGATGSATAKYASIVIDAHSGHVVHAVNADTKNYPASLTKIMTLYMVFDALDSGRLNPDQRLPVSARAAGQPPSRLALAQGDTITVRDAIGALVTKSANDVATVVAEALAGSEAEFARAMTRRAHELGMNDTTFRNASGLPNRGQLSTARDMATLARAMIETFPHHYHFFSIDSFSFKDHVHKNHNNLLGNYEGADGIKTGYIRASGFNLVASVARNGTRLIGVVFGGKTARSRDVHMASLLNKSWDKATALSFAGAQPLPKPQAPFTETVALEPADAPANFELPEREGGWAIQIGAFSAFGTAHAAARSAASRLRNLPGNASIEITPYRSRGSVVYRARLTGFDELTARAQCRELRRQGNACALVTPGGTVQLAGLAN